MKRHADNTECLEGTKKVPAEFKSCCAAFEGHVTACQIDIRYEWYENQGVWGILCADQSSFIEINHCPHCGQRLPKKQGIKLSN